MVRSVWFLLVPLLLAAAPPVRGPRDLERRMIEVQQEALTALVNIQPVTENFTGGEARKESAVGSGFLIDTDGHVVTNYHVAGRAKQLLVTLSNKERVQAELVGEDPLTDLAVIRIPKEKVAAYGLRPLALGSSKDLAVGAWVMALGSPLALARTMTAGIVSNAERYLPEGMTLPTGERTGDFNTWIQTDAAINPGNSGGPLIDLEGRVVGVNARGASFADNIGFAIPVDTARRVISELIGHGEVRRSWAGLEFQPLQDWEKLFKLATPRGVLVASVVPGGPADRGGIRAGDLVLSWSGEERTVRFDEELPAVYARIADTPIGTTVPVVVLREGQESTLSVQTSETGRLSGERFEASVWGFTVKGITEQMRYTLELDGTEGVLVEGVLVGGPAARGKLGRGFVVEAVDGRRVQGLADFEGIYNERSKHGGESVLLQLRSGDQQRYALVTLGDTRGTP